VGLIQGNLDLLMSAQILKRRIMCSLLAESTEETYFSEIGRQSLWAQDNVTMGPGGLIMKDARLR
jgi:hypothetical protein